MEPAETVCQAEQACVRDTKGNLGVRAGAVQDAGRPVRADNGRVASYSMHMDLDVRIDSDWITRIPRSA